jgi:hypothetical protein
MSTLRWARAETETAVLVINPITAQQMLTTSTGNRTMRGHYVKRLADAMLRGEWRVTSQGIGFDVTGALRDGHHRLSAIIQSGVTVELPVVMGMPVTAYQVTDIGMRRTYAELLGEDRIIAEVLLFAAQHALGVKVPSVDQIAVMRNSKLYATATALQEFCSLRVRNFSVVPVRLAACVEVLNGGRQAFVFEQYRAMCTLDYDQMTHATRAYVRQVQMSETSRSSTVTREGKRNEQLARALRVFDEDRKDVTRIQMNESTISASVELVRSVLRNAIEYTLDVEGAA